MPAPLSWEDYKARLVEHAPGYRLPPGSPRSWLTDTLLNEAPEAVLSEAGKTVFDPSPWANSDERAAEALSSRLRPEDKTSEPALRVENRDSIAIVVEWNRALADLTGITAAEVVGHPFKDIIAPLRLSRKYRAATLSKVAAACNEADEDVSNEYVYGCDVDKRRAARFFPLPLPVLSGKSDRAGYWVELLVKQSWSSWRARKQILEVRASLTGETKAVLDVYESDVIGEVRSTISSCLNLPDGSFTLLNERGTILTDSCRIESINTEWRRQEDASSEPQVVLILKCVGQQKMPVGWLCGREFTLRHFELGDEGSCVKDGTKFDDSDPAPLVKATSTDLVRAFLREACHVVRQATHQNRIRNYEFSRSWKNEPETAALYPVLLAQLGAFVRGEKTLPASRRGRSAYDVWKLGDTMDDMSGYVVARAFLRTQMSALSQLSPWRHLNGPDLVPFIEDPKHTILTLKIEVAAEEGMLVRSRDDDWNPSGAKWVIVAIPATLSLWQLHRVVIQAMTASDSCGGTCHSWSCKNPLDPEHSVRLNYEPDRSILETVQRLALDGVIATHYDCIGKRMFGRIGRSCLTCCEHRVSVCAALFHPGTSIRLEDGFTRYGQDYLITLQFSKLTSTVGEAAEVDASDSHLNIGLPVVLEGKAFDDDDWSVHEANKQLHADRAALRRELSFDEFSETSFAVPWCTFSGRPSLRRYGSPPVPPVPMSLWAEGGDAKPMVLRGEPPFSGDEFVWYLMEDSAGRSDFADKFPMDECGELGCGVYSDSDVGSNRADEVEDNGKLRGLLYAPANAKKRPAAAPKAKKRPASAPTNRRLRSKQSLVICD